MVSRASHVIAVHPTFQFSKAISGAAKQLPVSFCMPVTHQENIVLKKLASTVGIFAIYHTKVYIRQRDEQVFMPFR
ncbi:hypothetical protein VT47_00435 [Pseudomonas syringae pv. syringae]|nr:hypothetical protein VT47_00435 [Pseudomonas syringae pv. syringae]